MKKTLLKLLLLLCPILFLCGSACEKMFNPVWGVSVKNQSDKDVYFVVGLNWIDDGYYPTTELPHDSNRKELVKAGQSVRFFYPSYNGPEDIKIKGDDLIALFVIDPDTLKKYTWDQLRTNENFLRKTVYIGADFGGSPHHPIIYP
ncbi:MAG: hypothetical protein LBM20_03040 [Rikenellaceae bacterium]|jgi:hypothetical protein|nr:hypothetical protein [Rikenellaceae bacterium]